MIDLNNFETIDVTKRMPKKAEANCKLTIRHNGLSLNRYVAEYFGVNNQKPANLKFLVDAHNKQMVILNCKKMQNNAYQVKPYKKTKLINIAWSNGTKELRNAFEKLGLKIFNGTGLGEIDDPLDFDNTKLKTSEIEINYQSIIKDDLIKSLQNINSDSELQLFLSKDVLNHDPNWRVNYENLQKMIQKYPNQFTIVKSADHEKEIQPYLKLNLTKSGLDYIKNNFVNYSKLTALVGIKTNNVLYLPSISAYSYLLPVGIIKDNKYVNAVINEVKQLNKFNDPFYLTTASETYADCMHMHYIYHLLLKPDTVKINKQDVKCLFIDFKNKEQVNADKSIQYCDYSDQSWATPLVQNQENI